MNHEVSNDEARSSSPKFAIVKWHELWVVRAAFLSFTIVGVGYLLSLVVAIQGIESITNMAFDPKIEKQMDQHLSVIKKNHKFRQETFSARMNRVIPPIYRRGEAPIKKFMVEKWLDQIEMTSFISKENIKVEEIKKEEIKDYPSTAIIWVDSATFKVRNFLVHLPKEIIRKEFQEAEDLILKHRAIRANWTNEIKPTLISLQLAIVLLTGFLVIASLFVIFRRFRKNIDLVVEGFTTWSEDDPTFRFRTPWTGELKYLSARFNHMADEVDENRNRLVYLEKVASWQIIARKLAHEIKNPLTPIQMMVTQLARRYKGEDEDFKNLLEDSKNIISEEVLGLRRMVDNFSKFAQMPQPKLEPNDLIELARRVTELEKAGFPDHSINFSSELSSAFAQIDDQLIRQVLINIIKNAAEASSDRKATISVIVQDTGRYFSIVIQDDGPGIPEDLQSRVFEAYFTTKHTGPSPGMGLGLAVCQKVLLEHGGDLKLKSSPGDTRFFLTLPKAPKR